MQAPEKNRFRRSEIATQSVSMNPRAALPATCFLVMAIVLAVAAATPLAVLIAGS